VLHKFRLIRSLSIMPLNKLKVMTMDVRTLMAYPLPQLGGRQCWRALFVLALL
jgi:hypothetical protein